MSYLEFATVNGLGSSGFVAKVKNGIPMGSHNCLRLHCTCISLWDWDTHEWHWVDCPGPCGRSSLPTIVIGPGPGTWGINNGIQQNMSLLIQQTQSPQLDFPWSQSVSKFWPDHLDQESPLMTTWLISRKYTDSYKIWTKEGIMPTSFWVGLLPYTKLCLRMTRQNNHRIMNQQQMLLDQANIIHQSNSTNASCFLAISLHNISHCQQCPWHWHTSVARTAVKI